MHKENRFELNKKLHRRIAQISVGPSAIRNQGAKGIIAICRDYFENTIDLEEFRNELVSDNFKTYLDIQTKNLVKLFPDGGKSWGAARKGLNLFFREVSYNFYLANYLEIPFDLKKNGKVLSQLEVPLDKDVALCLMKLFPDLPKWQSIKNLTPSESNQYQAKAKHYAEKLKIPRIHLDLEFWRKDR